MTTIERPRPAVAPKPLPVVDGLPGLGSLTHFLRDPFTFFERATATHGDLYSVKMGPARFVVLGSPHHTQHVLQTNVANYAKAGPIWDLLRNLLGNGLVVSDGEFWQRQRRIMQPEFHSKRLAALTDLMIEAIDDSINSWHRRAADGDLELVPATNQITMSVITRTLFGASLTRAEFDDIGRSMGHIIDYLMRGTVFNMIPDQIPLPGKRHFYQAIERFDQTVYRLIAEARRDGAETTNHLLAILLNAVDGETGEPMTDEQLRDEIATLFIAGYETTSMAISWALINMRSRPDIVRLVTAEVDDVVGRRQPHFDDLAKLTYTRQVFDETMRLTPSVWFLPRLATDDDVIDGYRIPGGSEVMLLNYMIHRHPDHWEDPDCFDPDRFSPERSQGRHQYAYAPFGAGRRLCIGKSFAQMEGTLILAMLMQRFRIRVKPRTVTPAISTTLRPKGKLPVSVELR